MGNILYLIALLHNAYTVSVEPPTNIVRPQTLSTSTTTSAHHAMEPLPIGAYGLIRKMFDMPRLPLNDLYKFPKKYPTIYNLFSSVDFAALQNTPLKAGDAIVVKQPELLHSPGPHLFFDVATPDHVCTHNKKNPHLVQYNLTAGPITIYSWYQPHGELPIIEHYRKNVIPRDP